MTVLFSELLGVDVREFFERYFDREFLFAPSKAPHAFSDLLSPKDVEFLVATSPATGGLLQLRKNGAAIALEPPLVRADGSLHPAKVASHFRDGYSIVLNHVRRRHPRLNDFCVKLEQEFCEHAPFELQGQFSSNVYLTPPRSQGFTPHFDGHSVLVLQLAGSKQWSVFERQERYPLEMRPKIGDSELGDPSESFTLRAGDAFYMPRGTPHFAVTGDEHSLHVTLGIRCVQWADVIISMLKEARGSGEFIAKNTLGEAAAALRYKLNELQSTVSVDETLSRLGAQNLYDSILAASGFLTQPSALPSDTPVRKNNGSRHDIVAASEHLVLTFPGGGARYPKHFRAALDAVLEAELLEPPFVFDGLDKEEGDSLIASLLRIGFLIPASPVS